MSTRITFTVAPAPAEHSAKNASAGAGLPNQPTDQSGRTPMVPTTAAHGEQPRAFIGAYAPRFLDADTRGRLTVNMAELDAVVAELIAAAVADALTGGEQA